MISSIDLRKTIIGIVICGSIGISNVLGQNIWSQTDKAVSPQSLGYAKFFKWSCTDYVASRRKDLFPSRGGKDRRFWGNAISWLPNAKKTGVPIGKQPQIWAIAVFGKWRWASSSYGHVAIVENIIDNRTIVVSDMNYTKHNVITKRIISDTIALGYIYTLPQNNTTDAYQNKNNIIIVAVSNKKSNIIIQAWSLIQISWSILLPQDTMMQIAEYNTWISTQPPIEPWTIQISFAIDNRNIIKNLTTQYRAHTYTAMIAKKYNNNLFSMYDTS
jgi:surface antigen